MAQETKPQSFVEKFRSGVLSSIPAVSVLTFVIVAVKVFRASGMEASTTVAVVSGADLVALLEGVILTLLPSFLALVIAAAIWWWGRSLPADGDKQASREALLSPDHATAWVLAAVGFFTIPWPFFLALAVPLFLSALWLLRHVRDRRPKLAWLRMFRVGIFVACLLVAVPNVAFLALSSTVWLPLRLVQVLPGQSVELAGERLPDELGAYVLSQDDHRVILLLDSPRAVIEVGPDVLAPNPPICIPEPARWRDVFYRRPVQVLGLEADTRSPYPRCPG